MARKMLRNVEKRGVQAARNGPSPPPCVAQAEIRTADHLIAEGWQGVLRHAVLETIPLGELADPAKPVASVHFAFPDIMGMWFNLVQCPVHATWLPIVQRVGVRPRLAPLTPGG